MLLQYQNRSTIHQNCLKNLITVLSNCVVAKLNFPHVISHFIRIFQRFVIISEKLIRNVSKSLQDCPELHQNCLKFVQNFRFYLTFRRVRQNCLKFSSELPKISSDVQILIRLSKNSTELIGRNVFEVSNVIFSFPSGASPMCASPSAHSDSSSGNGRLSSAGSEPGGLNNNNNNCNTKLGDILRSEYLSKHRTRTPPSPKLNPLPSPQAITVYTSSTTWRSSTTRTGWRSWPPPRPEWSAKVAEFLED